MLPGQRASVCEVSVFLRGDERSSYAYIGRDDFLVFFAGSSLFSCD